MYRIFWIAKSGAHNMETVHNLANVRARLDKCCNARIAATAYTLEGKGKRGEIVGESHNEFKENDWIWWSEQKTETPTRREETMENKSKRKECADCRDCENPNYDDDIRLTVVRDPETRKIRKRAYMCDQHREMYAQDGYTIHI